MKTKFALLPEEMIGHIYDYTDLGTMYKLSRVSKHVRRSSSASKEIFKYPVARKKKMLLVVYLLIGTHIIQALSFAAFVTGFALFVTDNIIDGIIIMTIFGVSTVCLSLVSVIYYAKYGFTYPSKNEYATVTGTIVPDDILLSTYGTINYDKYIHFTERAGDPVETWDRIHGVRRSYT